MAVTGERIPLSFCCLISNKNALEYIYIYIFLPMKWTRVTTFKYSGKEKEDVSVGKWLDKKNLFQIIKLMNYQFD